MNYRRPIYDPANFHPSPRNQPYPYQAVQNGMAPISTTKHLLSADLSQSYQPYQSAYQPVGMPQQVANPTGQYPPKDAQFLFENPLQPKEQMVTKSIYAANEWLPCNEPVSKAKWYAEAAWGNSINYEFI